MFNIETVPLQIVKSPSRPLPANRQMLGDPMDLMTTIGRVVRGKLSLSQTIEMLALHKTSPQTHTAVTLAKQYNLDIDNTVNILKYYTIWNVNLGGDGDKDKISMPVTDAPEAVKGNKAQISSSSRLLGKKSSKTDES